MLSRVVINDFNARTRCCYDNFEHCTYAVFFDLDQFETAKPYLYGLGYPRQPFSPRPLPAPSFPGRGNFSLQCWKIQPSIHMMMENSSRGGGGGGGETTLVGELSRLGRYDNPGRRENFSSYVYRQLAFPGQESGQGSPENVRARHFAECVARPSRQEKGQQFFKLPYKRYVKLSPWEGLSRDHIQGQIGPKYNVLLTNLGCIIFQVSH